MGNHDALEVHDPLPMMTHPVLRLFLCTVLSLAVSVSHAQKDSPHQPLEDSRAFESMIVAHEKSGVLTPDQALLYGFQYMFDPEELPPEYQVPSFSPLKCGSDLVRKFWQMKDELDPDTKTAIQNYLQLETSRASFTSLEGNFILHYDLVGEDAVPGADLNPANGVPDYVERAGQYLEQSWTVEVLMMGFIDPLPASNPIPVHFRDMQNYGYAYVLDEDLGHTGIVLHHNFEGFPSNTDPDGNVLGALKVTAAHELKHSSQYAGSRWSEGGWIELDAVWAEDLVFDQTNDYYAYLSGGSPIRRPEISLDGGSTGTGSYEDCIWQHWMSENWGSSIIVDFWFRRAYYPEESVLTTYEEVLQDRGVGIDQGWGEFTAWNYLTNDRAVAGLGYEEAAHYPLGPVVSSWDALPANHSGEVEHLAANVMRLVGLSDLGPGGLEIEFLGDAEGAPLNGHLVIHKTDGTVVLEPIAVLAGQSVLHTATVEIHDIDEAAIVVGNPQVMGEARDYEVTARFIEQTPQPLLVLEAQELTVELASGSSATSYFLLGNEGEEGSILAYQVSTWSTDPMVLVGGVEKNISGSTLEANPTEFLPGTLLNLELTVTNGSSDDEWLTQVQLEIPDGVSVVDAGPFVGGSLGDLVWSGDSGPGVNTAWEGYYGAQDYGVIRDGESATAEVELMINANIQGPVVLVSTIRGDQFGAQPHSVNTELVFTPELPLITLVQPVEGQMVPIGQEVSVVWTSDPSLEALDVFLSRDGGAQWEFLGNAPASQGEYSWVPEGPATLQGKIKLEDASGGDSVLSPGSFIVYEASEFVRPMTEAGFVPAGGTGAVVLEIDASLLSPGPRQAWVFMQHNGVGLPAILPVNMNVLEGVAFVSDMPVVQGLQGNFPNPFNPRTEIRFSLQQPGQVQLDVLDIAGRLVCTLTREIWPAGQHGLVWNGQDDQKRNMPAGVYLVRLKSAGFVATEKMLLAK